MTALKTALPGALTFNAALNMKTNPYLAEVTDLLAMLTAAGFTLHGVDDGGECIETYATLEATADAICGVDEAHLYVRTPEGKGRCLFIVLGNSPGELVNDWNPHPALDVVIAAHADKWEASR